MTTVILGAGGMAEAFEGIKVSQAECDVTSYSDVLATLATYEPSVVIVTAGASNPALIGEAEFAEELHTNLFGAFNVAHLAVRHNVQTMIFIASVAGLYGKPNHAAYCASKAGIISLVQSLAMEGHDAYAISPGRVDTPMREKDYPADTPGSRLDPERVGEVVQKILKGHYTSGDNILIRKVGLDRVVEHVVQTPWRDTLGVGQPVTI